MTSTTNQGPGQKASEMADQARQKAASAADEATEQARSTAETQRRKAAGRLTGVADALRSTSKELQSQDEQMMAQYTHVAADQVEQFGHYLENRDIGELMETVQHFAQRQPQLFVAGSLAAGFFVGRFFGSSAPDGEGTSRGADRSIYARGDDGSVDSFSKARRPTGRGAHDAASTVATTSTREERPGIE